MKFTLPLKWKCLKEGLIAWPVYSQGLKRKSCGNFKSLVELLLLNASFLPSIAQNLSHRLIIEPIINQKLTKRRNETVVK